MKRLSLLLAAGFLALTACSAAPESEPAAATPEEATAEEATTEEAAAPAEETSEKLYSISHRMGYSPSAYYEVVPNYNEAGEQTGTDIYKSDFSTGKTPAFYHTDSLFATFPFIADDTLYLVNSDMLLARPMNGSSVREIPYDGSTWYDVLYSERYLYFISMDNAPWTRTRGMRLDLQTGESDSWALPDDTVTVLDSVGDEVLITRIVSDYPVPLPDDLEMANAILQNSQYEYDLIDTATGQIVRNVLTYPYNGEIENDTRHNYFYLNKNGEDIYFWVENTNLTTQKRDYSVLCVHSDGTQQDLGITADTVYDAIPQGDDLQWIMVYDSHFKGFTVYDLQGNQLAQISCPADLLDYYPLRLLDDGRVLIRIGYDESGRNLFATIDAEAFLSGSTEYTELALAE